MVARTVSYICGHEIDYFSIHDAEAWQNYKCPFCANVNDPEKHIDDIVRFYDGAAFETVRPHIRKIAGSDHIYGIPVIIHDGKTIEPNVHE